MILSSILGIVCGAVATLWPYLHSQCMGEYHLVRLVGEGTCQPGIFTKSSWGCELSYETLPITLCVLWPLLFKVVLWPNFGHSTTVNVWERIGEKALGTIFHNSWERGRVNLIFHQI